jgi:hypothetical protein
MAEYDRNLTDGRCDKCNAERAWPGLVSRHAWKWSARGVGSPGPGRRAYAMDAG